MNNDRRDFFKTLGTAAAGVAAIAPLVTATTASGAITQTAVANRHTLFLGGKPVGPLSMLDGGDAVGEVVEVLEEAKGIYKKHLGNVRYQPISMQFGGGMEGSVFEWIAAMVRRKPKFLSGEVWSSDVNGTVRNQLLFDEAVLSEVVFPGVDASSKDVAKFQLKAVPSIAKSQKPTAGLKAPSENKKAKQFRPSNFRIEIGELPIDATRRIVRVAPLVVEQPTFLVDGSRSGELEIEPLRVGNIVFEVPEAFAEPFFAWHNKFVVEGQSADGNETFFVLRHLGPNLKEVLFTLFFNNVGIIRATRQGEMSANREVRTVEVELYAETVDFFVGDLPSA